MKSLWLAVAAIVVGGLMPRGAAGLDTGVRAGWMRLSDDRSGAFMTGLFLRGNRGRIVHWDGSLYYHTKEIARDVDIEMMPVQLSAMLYLLGRDGLVSPFVLGGGGVYWTRTVGGGRSGSKLDLGWHLGAGLNYALSDRLFIEAEARYIWLRLNPRGRTLADALSDYNHLLGTVGLGFRL